MPWAKATHRVSGETHYDLSPDALDPDLYDVVLIADDRCPEGIEQVDADGAIFVPVDILREQLWARVKAIRYEKENGTAVTPVGTVQIDEASKAKIQGALELCKLAEEVGQAFSLKFTMADNSRVTLDNTTVRQMAGAAGQYVSTLYDYSFDLRDALDAATTVETLTAIEIETGWP